jgi:urocanate hydratase
MSQFAIHEPRSQTLTLWTYTILSLLREDWAGSWILCCGLGSQGLALGLASNIAGAACLAIDERPEVCRAAMRTGACDFVVNTVDEALRVLKNEIRQRKPISVGLELASVPALSELLDRGLLPQLFTVCDSDEMPVDQALCDRAIAIFKPLGCQIVQFDQSFGSLADVFETRNRLEDHLAERNLCLESFSFDSVAALRSFDAKLQALIPSDDPRHRWVTVAPALFHRDRPLSRVVYLTDSEQALLRA